MKSMDIYDTTLRDGGQSEDVAFTSQDKIEIARALDRLGVDYIELGWPASNETDKRAFEMAKHLSLSHAQITAFTSTHRTDREPEHDAGLDAVVRSGATVACVFGKTWEPHVRDQLNVSLERNLEIIEGTVGHLRGHGMDVVYDAEHFFDGFKDDPDYAMRCLRVAESAGASALVLCDTNGGTMPDEFASIVSTVRSMLDESAGTAKLGVHTHNDSNMAEANVLVSLPYIDHIQGTINGFGERCGNADLCSILPGLMLKKGVNLPKVDLQGLKDVSNLVYTLSNNQPRKSQPYVGRSAFCHKGGVHADAMTKGRGQKDPSMKGASYEHIDPKIVGNESRMIVSDVAGKANVVDMVNQFGYEPSPHDPRVREMLMHVKEREALGYDLSSLHAERYLIVSQFFGDDEDPLEIPEWRVMTGVKGDSYSEAIIRGTVNGHKEASVAPLDTDIADQGPVGELYHAMQRLVGGRHDSIYNVHLTNYKVRIAQDNGADSTVRVFTEYKDNGNEWATVGVSANIMDASREAIEKGFRYYLMTGGNRMDRYER